MSIIAERYEARGMCNRCGRQPPRDGMKSCQSCADRRREADRRLRITMRKRVYNAYGGQVCACCGETTYAFLTIDHINGGGRKHREEIGDSSKSLLKWLIGNDFPDGFQVLCFNCNRAKHDLGICPHKEAVNG